MTTNGCNYSPTQYATQVGGASGTLTSLAIGSANQLLISNGASANPTFQTNTNCWTLLSTQNPSNAATVDFTSLISSTYINYVLVIDNLVSGAVSPILEMVISTDNGAHWLGASYLSGAWYVPYNSASFGTNNNTTSCFYLESTTNSAYTNSGVVWLYGFGVSGYPAIEAQWQMGNNWSWATGFNGALGTYNAIRLHMGNISSGTFSLYGVSK
jgi:hypothetical protein